MEIWVTWCKKRAICKWCDKPIEVATPITMGKLWKGKGDRKRTIRLYWHPKCWMEQAMKYLENNPYIPGLRGRKKLDLNPVDTRQRFLLIRRYNRYRQRLDVLPEDNVMKVIKLSEKMESVKQEMENIGGIPKTWLTP